MLTRRFRVDQISHHGRDRIRSQFLRKPDGWRDRTEGCAHTLSCPSMSAFLATHTRTHSCGALRATDAGKQVVLTGWVQSYRDHGERIFVDLRDREGVTQIVADKTRLPAVHAVADTLRAEWCIGITGEVRLRGEQLAKAEPGEERKMKRMTNEKIPTGEIEVWIDEIEVFSKAETPPFAI